MWQASELAAFAGVVEASSFTRAAQRLGVPKVAISRAVASLEKRLGVQLLTRTTRRMQITPAGKLLLPHCQRILAEAEAAVRLAAPATALTSLRIAADGAYGRLLLAPLIPRFLASFPNIPLQVGLADQAGGWDVLISNGEPPAASGETPLAATSLGKPLVLLCVAAAYAKANALPKSPNDLTSSPLLVALADERPTLRLHRGAEGAGETLDLRCEPRLAVNDPAVVHSSTVAGLGIGVLPEFLCRQGLATGKLVRVLPQWSVEGLLNLHAVSALRHSQDPAVSAFIQFLGANLVPALA